MPIQLDNCGHTCHFSCLRAAFCEQIIRRPHRCVCPQCGIDAKIHHVEQAQAYQPTENEIFYARTQYFLEVELYGQPVTPVPDWLVPHLGEQR
ncbi:hypothetical protein UCRNP2_9500 [Neofusicoccum parvum UCRNP2]|uniref:Uncharacterized protein n=2 Tax=Neofusicoccum parvum TaxID=310453 RepID=R1FXB2_BOTPV|nr:hypothetical protein UCRNP2_9500 [Neofusicoccum parvum UCRNP2]GME23184.1 hypothetical protein NpPPO83_00005676 [Neofusicoccum parvum]